MKNKIKIILGLFLLTNSLYAQETQDVTDKTFKIGGVSEEELFFGFAEGDKIIFNFKEENNKELKEIEIVEYPNNSKFSDYKSKIIENKTINVTKQGVYIFRFKNSAINGRVCKVNIQRIPANNETKNFNTTVTWINKQDTSYNNYTKEVLIGYDTVYTEKTKKELVRTEYSEEMIMDKIERVNSVNNLSHSNQSVFSVQLPQNSITNNFSKKISSWAYWISVGKEGQEAWNKNLKAVSNVAGSAMSLAGGGPLGNIAVGALTTLITPTMGDDVAYWFMIGNNNAQLFMNKQQFMQFDKGRGMGGFGRNTKITQGVFFIGLSNDNQLRAIDVNVKITVIWETKYFEDIAYTEMNTKPKYEKKQFSDPIIKSKRVPIAGE